MKLIIIKLLTIIFLIMWILPSYGNDFSIKQSTLSPRTIIKAEKASKALPNFQEAYGELFKYIAKTKSNTYQQIFLQIFKFLDIDSDTFKKNIQSFSSKIKTAFIVSPEYSLNGLLTPIHENFLEQMSKEELEELVIEYDTNQRNYHRQVVRNYAANRNDQANAAKYIQKISAYENLIIDKVLDILDYKYSYWENSGRQTAYLNAALIKGRRIGGTKLAVDLNVKDVAKAIDKALKDIPIASNIVIENFGLTKTGGFRYKTHRVYDIPGRELEKVTALLVNNKIEDLFDKSGLRIFPVKGENEVYIGSSIKNGKRSGGKKVAEFRDKKELTKNISKHPDCIIENVPLTFQGGFKLLNQHLWDKKSGYGLDLVTVVIKNGLIKAVYSSQGEELYGKKNIGIYINAKIKNGKISEGEKLKVTDIEPNDINKKIRGFTEKLAITGYPVENNATINWQGETIHLPGNAGKTITIVAEKGSIEQIFNEESNLIYPFAAKSLIYINGKIKDGKREDGEVAQYLINYTDHVNFLPDFPDCILEGAKLTEKGSLKFMGRYFLKEIPGYTNDEVTLEIIQKELFGIYDNIGTEIYKQPVMTVYSKFQDDFTPEDISTFQDDNKIAVAENKKALNDVILNFPDCIINDYTLDHNGGLIFNNEYIWNALPRYENRQVIVVIKDKMLNAVFDKSGNKLHPLPKVQAYIKTQIVNGILEDGQAIDEDVSTPAKRIKVAKKYNSVVFKNFPLNGHGGFDFNLQHYGGDPKNRNKQTTAITENGIITHLYRDNGLQIYRPPEKKTYTMSIGGHILKGDIINPEKTLNFDNDEELKRQLQNTSKSFVTGQSLLKEGGLKFMGEWIWHSKTDYAYEPVIIELEMDNVTAVYKEDGIKIYPQEPVLVTPVIFEDELNYKKTGETIQIDKSKLKNYILEYPDCIIEDARVSDNGRLHILGEPVWQQRYGITKKDSLSILVKNSSPFQVLDKNNTELYKLNWIYVYVDAKYESGKIIDYSNIIRVKSQLAFLKILKNDPAFNGVIDGINLTNKGGLEIGGPVFDSREGYTETDRVTVIYENGELQTVYDDNGELLFPFEIMNVYLDATIKDGKVVSGNIHKKIYHKKNIISIAEENPDRDITVTDVPLKKYGRLDFLGALWPSMTGYEEGDLVTVIVRNKKVISVFDEKGVKLFPFDTPIKIYKNLRFDDEKIIMGEALFEFKSKRSFNTTLKSKQNDFKDQELWAGPFPLTKHGGLIRILGKDKWTIKAGYDNTNSVYVLIKNNDVIEAYDENGTPLYKAGLQNWIFINGKIVNGKREGGEFKGAIDHKTNLHKFVQQHPECIIEKFKLTEEGRLNWYGKYYHVSDQNKYKDSDVTIEFKGGDIYRVFDEAGKTIYISEDKRLEVFDKLWQEYDVERLISVFGISNTHRLLLRFYEDMSAKEFIKYINLIFKNLPYAKKRLFNNLLNKHHEKPVSDFTAIVRENPIFKDFEKIGEIDVLAEELIRLSYHYMVKENRFLELLKTESLNPVNSHFLRKAYSMTYNYYTKLNDKKFTNLHSHLKYYQKAGVDFILSKKKVILADEPGVGKTIQTLAAAMNINDGNGADKVLIVCPQTSKTNVWEKQIEQHLRREENTFVVKSKKQFFSQKGQKKLEKARFVIINYDMFSHSETKVIVEALKNIKFDFIILDEAHKIRNNSLRTNAISQFDAEYKVLVSGTPFVGRKTSKLFYMLNWLYPELFPSLKSFVNDFKGKKGKKKLKEILKDFMVRRHLTDILQEIPGIEIEERNLKMEKEQAARYRHIENAYLSNEETNFLQELYKLKLAAITSDLIPGVWIYNDQGEEVEFVAFNKTRRLFGEKVRFSRNNKGEISIIKYMENNLKLFEKISKNSKTIIGENEYTVKKASNRESSNKLKEVEKIVSKVMTQKQENLVIFTGSRVIQSKMQKRLIEKGYNVVLMHGEISMTEREKIIKNFNQSDTPTILITTYQTGGESIDLIGARYGIIVDRPWTYQDEDQMIRRLYRLGQNKAVKIFILKSLNTIDDHIGEVITEGKGMQQLILDDPYPNAENQKQIISQLARREEESFERLLELQKITRERSAKIKDINLSVIKNDRHIKYQNGKLDLTMKNKKGMQLEIFDWNTLIKATPDFDIPSFNLLIDFFIKRFEIENNSEVRVKDMILWKMLDNSIEGFKTIDFDPRLEIIVEIGSFVLRELVKNPEISPEEITRKLKGFPKKTIQDALYYLDGVNIFKLFAYLKLIPKTYHLDGNLVRYDKDVQIHYSNNQLYYSDPWIVEQIAPKWDKKNNTRLLEEVSYTDQEPYAFYSKMMDIVRELSSDEEFRLSYHAEKRNISAEKVLHLKACENIPKIAKRVQYTINRKLGGVSIEFSDLVSEGSEIALDLVKRYIFNGVYERLSLKDYLKERLPSKLYGIGYKLAKQKFELSLNSTLSSDSDTTRIDMLADEKESLEDKIVLKELYSDLGIFLYNNKFSETDVTIITSHLDGSLDEEKLKRTFTLGNNDIEKTLKSFNALMSSIGQEKLLELLNSPTSSDKEVEFMVNSGYLKLLGPPMKKTSLTSLEKNAPIWLKKATNQKASNFDFSMKDIDGNQTHISVEAVMIDVGDELPPSLAAWRIPNQDTLVIAYNGKKIRHELLIELVFHEYSEREFFNTLYNDYLERNSTKPVDKALEKIKRKAHILASYKQSLLFSHSNDLPSSDIFALIRKQRGIKYLTQKKAINEFEESALNFSRYVLTNKFIHVYEDSTFTYYALSDSKENPTLFSSKLLLDRIKNEHKELLTAFMRLSRGNYISQDDLFKLKQVIAEFEIHHYFKRLKKADSFEVIQKISSFIDTIGNREAIIGKTNLGSLKQARINASAKLFFSLFSSSQSLVDDLLKNKTFQKAA